MMSTSPSATSPAVNPIRPSSHTSSQVYITVHGHFYQPPRENPYLDTIERQPSAAPFHNWNERIADECYRPNAFARIFNDAGEVVNIVNNYEYLSFNIGPTLMSWLENHDRETYDRIIEGDRKSKARLGHGNAIAQVYNHIILPLANERDKYTQIRWGKADFCQRFGRDPEGMWLAETAVDYATLEVLINENIRFIILAPSQAEKCREFPRAGDPEPLWHGVGGGQIDTTRPYRCFLPSNREKFIDIFFYDGPISRDMGFNDVLISSHHLAGRLSLAIRGDQRPSQLISVATDGETFGHHKKDTEKCLAYAFTREFPQRGWLVSNFAHYLHAHPPTWEVELKPITAWSCCHGVDRWQEDCGCGGGGEWHQQWRKPLRESLNELRDRLIAVYEQEAPRYLRDPWGARDAYIQVILQRDLEQVQNFFHLWQNHPLNSEEQIDTLRLLEMQRHSLLMFTSCGWFFEEISRPEGVQILRYAARAMELATEVAGVTLEEDFIQHLRQAPSNVDTYGDGEGVYDQLVRPSQVTFRQVVAHYGINSLFTTYLPQERIYGYDIHQLDYDKQQLGPLTFAMGQVMVRSVITWEQQQHIFAVLHLGGWDFHCCLHSGQGRSVYARLHQHLMQVFHQASAVQMILAMGQSLGGESFGLAHLFAEERHRTMERLTLATQRRLDQLYTQIYRDNYSILVAFQRDELAPPQELQVAAEVALSSRCREALIAWEEVADRLGEWPAIALELQSIGREAAQLHCPLQLAGERPRLEHILWRGLQSWFLDQGDPTPLIQGLHLAQSLHSDFRCDRLQEAWLATMGNHPPAEPHQRLQQALKIAISPQRSPITILVD